MSYMADIWACRYFWWHLAKSELRARFRYSKLGMAWALVQPLMMTALLTLVVSVLSAGSGSALETAPFVFSGIIMWDLLSGAVLSGSLSILSAEPYVRQRRLPIAIYPLRTVLTSFTLFLMAFTGFAVWALATRHQNISWPLLSVPPTFVLLLAITWPLAIISSFLYVKFRDFQQVMMLVLQAVFYVSGVFIQEDFYRKSGKAFLLDCNPVFHVLNLIRAPLLKGCFPSPYDYAYTLGLAAALAAIAAWKIKREERSLIFYF